ncbi:D-alanyl-D-alanine carboxypeptidase/D-alanyl-D-alanine endopeptidase [Streptomyces bottropensis]|uniref:D-alanyl-D-alanine carboxypeptidase/D-alanyl-D-alanine endopeptidase n=1 Tax=Streptomyces bottropensis TaxID=42235 RepID=UPI003676C6A3
MSAPDPAPDSHPVREFGVGARRALTLAMAVSVASAALVGPSAFAADGNTIATPPHERGGTARAVRTTDTDEGLDSADRAIAANLDTRVIDERLGANVSGVVLDAESDGTVWDHNSATALMPASNTKLATATAALTVLGPDHQFETRVVYGHGTLTLVVGGGDRTLTSADLAAMAKDAAVRLKAAGTRVKVAVDDSLLPEPTLARGWKADYLPGDIAPVRALVVDGHAVNDTSVDAGQAFAEQLATYGITVDAEITRRTAKITDVLVTRHMSAKLSDIVHHMLKVSDSNTAETLLRMTALRAGQPATFEGGTAVVRDVLSRQYGVSLENFEMYDGSGLSRDTRIPARTLAEILDLLTEKRYEHQLISIREGLPVSGETGSTLGTEFGRFDDANSKCAVGKVHAKTGTLTGAIALSGLPQGKDGRWKVFSFVENGSTASNSAIRDAMDGLAATVNGCWAGGPRSVGR